MLFKKTSAAGAGDKEPLLAESGSLRYHLEVCGGSLVPEVLQKIVSLLVADKLISIKYLSFPLLVPSLTQAQTTIKTYLPFHPSFFDQACLQRDE